MAVHEIDLTDESNPGFVDVSTPFGKFHLQLANDKHGLEVVWVPSPIGDMMVICPEMSNKITLRTVTYIDTLKKASQEAAQ